MKTGNAILVAVFIWICYEVPKNIWIISQEYGVSEYAGLNMEIWFTIAFIVSFICALLALLTGADKEQIKFRRKKKPDPVDSVKHDLYVQPREQLHDVIKTAEYASFQPIPDDENNKKSKKVATRSPQYIKKIEEIVDEIQD